MKTKTKEKAHGIRNYLFMLGFVIKNAPMLLFSLLFSYFLPHLEIYFPLQAKKALVFN